jgi:hypothetical protein
LQYTFKPIILIGAARSGTKMLRDVIAVHPQIDRVPYDVNYIWRMGNDALPHDELSPSKLTPQIRQNIINEFTREHSTGKPYLIEKTVSNTLRVPFIEAVFPNALYVHLTRDGIDVIESVKREWVKPPDWKYIMGKARSFPISKAPGYAFSYGLQTIRKTLSRNSAPAKAGTWGPRYIGIDEDVARYTILQVCAHQWVHSVETPARDLAAIPAERVIDVRYEEFVRDPAGHLEKIAAFIGIDAEPYTAAASTVTTSNISKGRSALGEEQLASIRPIIAASMARLGYPI